jgi:8-oxo-dGTP diphosphatase
MKQIWRYLSTIIGIIFRHPVTGVTLIPVLADGKIVLVRRQDTKRWGLPGGMIDWGQDIPTTIVRELKEETGLDFVKMGRLVGVYSAPDRDPRLHSLSIAIEVEAAGKLQVQDTLEILEVQAFSQKDLPLGNLSHDHDRQLKDYLQGVTTIA